MSVPVLVSRCFEIAKVYTAHVLDTYTRLEGEADLAGEVREVVAGDVAGDLAGEVGEFLAGEVGGNVGGDVAGYLAGEVGEGDGGQKCQICAATCASSPASTPHHHHERSLSPKLTTRLHENCLVSRPFWDYSTLRIVHATTGDP